MFERPLFCWRLANTRRQISLNGWNKFCSVLGFFVSCDIFFYEVKESGKRNQIERDGEYISLRRHGCGEENAAVITSSVDARCSCERLVLYRTFF